MVSFGPAKTSSFCWKPRICSTCLLASLTWACPRVLVLISQFTLIKTNPICLLRSMCQSRGSHDTWKIKFECFLVLDFWAKISVAKNTFQSYLSVFTSFILVCGKLEINSGFFFKNNWIELETIKKSFRRKSKK